MGARDMHLLAARRVAAAVADPEVGRRWVDPSALEGMTIGTLAAHAARSVLQPLWYLDAELPDAPPITAEEYYAGAAALGMARPAPT